MLKRDVLTARLAEDLVGPYDEMEVVDARPSDVYLTGILWPQNTPVPPDQDDRLAIAGGTADSGEGGEDSAQPSAFQMRRPSSAGISFAAASTQKHPRIVVDVMLARYEPLDGSNGTWARIPYRIEPLSIELVPGSYDLQIDGIGIEGGRGNVRAVLFSGGTLATVTLVNGSVPGIGRENVERMTLFQTGLVVRANEGSKLISRPSRRAAIDADDRSNALLFRKVREFATGHTCSAQWDAAATGDEMDSVRTTWIPEATA